MVVLCGLVMYTNYYNYYLAPILSILLLGSFLVGFFIGCGVQSRRIHEIQIINGLLNNLIDPPQETSKTSRFQEQPHWSREIHWFQESEPQEQQELKNKTVNSLPELSEHYMCTRGWHYIPVTTMIWCRKNTLGKDIQHIRIQVGEQEIIILRDAQTGTLDSIRLGGYRTAK